MTRTRFMAVPRVTPRSSAALIEDPEQADPIARWGRRFVVALAIAAIVYGLVRP